MYVLACMYMCVCRGKSPITDPLLIPTPSRISVNIRVIKKLYMHELLLI